MTAQNETSATTETYSTETTENKKKTCGLVMPISEIDGLPEGHWKDVRGILEKVATEQGFETKLVSAETVSGVLTTHIVTNLFENDIVICDVSARNPNVMFELGLRLAFDKPTIIIKDDVTAFVFDIQSIGHLRYPRTLRITEMEQFKLDLAQSLNDTYEKKQNDPDYSTFFSAYKIFEQPKVLEKSTNGVEYLSGRIDELFTLIAKSNVTAVKPDPLSRPEFFLSNSEINAIVDDAIEVVLKENNLSPLDILKDYRNIDTFLSKVNTRVSPRLRKQISKEKLLTQLHEILHYKGHLYPTVAEKGNDS